MYHHLRALRAQLPKAVVLAATTMLCGGGIAAAATDPPKPAGPELACERGQFCAWNGEFYAGRIARVDLRTANPEECLPLPDNTSAVSFANRLDRYVTVYQDVECSTEGDFSTYPGGGTFVPQAPYVVRAIQIAE